MTAREQERQREGRGITHAHAKLLVSKAWDGEVSAEETRALTEHLGRCPSCLREAERMRAFMKRLDDLLYFRCRSGAASSRQGPRAR
jgi:anti-sigma factor RsiW